ncbi:flagellar hook-length control protein FliK [Devosia lacusdianchii]|uniref:flagellar hook-length control protein FliK n=1 Tax=Devosia lacusdianchii TaxID=2917991 RepID=UPI001F065215|nr:flagellar hook-length control protein FliK [Devosia sp. JXJ CY 41]
MASHLLIIPNAAGAPAARAISAQANGEADANGAFAAFLGAPSQQDNAKASTEASLGLGNLLSLAFGAGLTGEDDQETADPEAIAAPIDAILPFQAETTPALGDLIDGLVDLKARLDAGEPLDPEALKRLDAMLQSLGEALDIDLTKLPSVDELAALATADLPEGASFQDQLTKALAPVAQSLVGGEVTADVELSTLAKSVGDKLAALLQSLNAGDLDPEKLAALGLDAETNIDADLQAAITKLLTPAAPVDPAATAPALAAPALKLTEPVLSGRPAEPAAAAETADAPTSTPVVAVDTNKDASADTSGDSKSDDKKPADTKAAVTIASTVDKLPDQQSAGQTPQQISRVDAAAAPRVVQAGYQTSQQQLNLPQLAFELVRQVNDGNTRFQMRLDPPELGRIDVKLDIDASGQVNARLTVEKAETLDLMQRDQRGLEKALQQAGLDGAKTNLEFSLKQNPGGNQQGQDGNGRTPLFGGEVTAEADEAPLPTVNLYRGSLTASGVNIIA